MEFKEILSRLSIPAMPKLNEEDQIKAEENNLSEVILNFSQKNTNFIALGFDPKDEEENDEVEYSDYSVEEYMDDIPS